jgi:integrase
MGDRIKVNEKQVRYDQIDFDTRRIFIPVAKAGEREQPITPALADAL